MRKQAYSFVWLATVAGIAVIGVVGACGGKVVVDASDPDGAGGAGGIGTGFGNGGSVITISDKTTTGAVVTSGPQVSTGPVHGAIVAVVATSVGSTLPNGAVTTGAFTTGSFSSVSASTGFQTGAAVSVAVSTGGPPPSPCTNACDKAASCGFDVCPQAGVNCDTLPPGPSKATCSLDCIGAASCSDIANLATQGVSGPLGLCLLKCQLGGASVAASTGSGPSPSTCQACTVQQCGGELMACGAQPGPIGCAAWLMCAQGCKNDSACLFKCDALEPKPDPQRSRIYECVCKSCDAQCASENACKHITP